MALPAGIVVSVSKSSSTRRTYVASLDSFVTSKPPSKFVAAKAPPRIAVSWTAAIR
jgi:hypothetical protein